MLEDPKKHYNSNETLYLQYGQHGNGVYLYLGNPNYNSSKRITLLRYGNWACGSNYSKNLYNSYESLTNIHLFVKEVGSRCGLKSSRHYY
jgi:hypothetical protein